jgi:hypothetical protein
MSLLSRFCSSRIQVGFLLAKYHNKTSHRTPSTSKTINYSQSTTPFTNVFIPL